MQWSYLFNQIVITQQQYPEQLLIISSIVDDTLPISPFVSESEFRENCTASGEEIIAVLTHLIESASV